MMDAFGFVPSLPQGEHYRPTHTQGGVLDWIFSRSMTSSVLHIDEQERDHHILSATLQRAHKEPEAEEIVRINYGALQTLTPEARAALQQDMEETMATADSENVVEVMRAVALKHLGRAKPPRRRLPKEWMSLQVKARHKEYRQAARRHRRCGTEHSKTCVKEAHTAFRRELRRAKRRADKQQGLEVEGGRKRVWSFVKPKKGAAHQTRLVSDMDETLQFWTQQFSDDEPLTEGDHTPNAEPVVYTEAQVNTVIREMADKAPGEDEIRVLLLKAVNSPQFRQELARVFTMITNAPGAVPQWMRRGLGKLIYKKKGSRKDPGNYRPIILAPVLAKVYEKLLEMKGRSMVVNSQLQVALEQGQATQETNNPLRETTACRHSCPGCCCSFACRCSRRRAQMRKIQVAVGELEIF